MATILFNSDIARLVLGYLKQQGLERAARVFCETSPYLEEELSAYKYGVQAYSFFPELAEIISEYVKIQQKVEEKIQQSNEAQTKVRGEKLSIKINYLLEHTFSNVVVDSSVQNVSGNVTLGKENSLKQTTSAAPATTTTRKRKRQMLAESSDSSMLAFKMGLRSKKRRSAANTFYYLNPSPQTCPKPTQPETSSLSESDIEVNVEHDSEVSMSGRPSSESTPCLSRSRRRKAPPMPKVTDISDAILENPEFQSKLVENINKALETAKPADSNQAREPTAVIEQVQQAANVSSADILDQLVKNIMEATENDPTFDEMIQDIVGCSTKSTAVQCELEPIPPPPASSAPIPLSTRTPIVRRNMMAKPDTQAHTNGSPNSSIGSLIDPNFSLSKLIVVNANESGQQKSQAFPGIGNITADQLLSQLALVHDTPSTSTGLAEAEISEQQPQQQQVHFDSSTGQLSFPLYLSNNELVEGVPFILNNELAESLANSEKGRIELTFSEPFVITGNAAGIFKTSTTVQQETQQEQPARVEPEEQVQHEKAVEQEQQADALETQRQIKIQLEQQLKASKEQANATKPESSVIEIERNTPTTLGIVSTNLQKNLSTPRRRNAHVRNLFSPIKSETTTALAGATPLSSRREPISRQLSIPTTLNEQEEEQQELVPAAEKTIELHTNESSNSCHVPPLFAASEDGGNQTIIQCEKPKPLPPLAKLSNTHDVATPKRRQVRERAVRACKRQISKSSGDSSAEDKDQAQEVGKEIDKSSPDAAKENQENVIIKPAEKVKTKEELMEEWQRLRSESQNDLDARLREINSKIEEKNPRKVKRRGPRKKLIDLKKKKCTASEERRNQKKDSKNVSLKDTKQQTSKKSVIAAVLERKTLTPPSFTAATTSTAAALAEEKFNKKQREFNIKIPTPQKSAEKSKRVAEALKAGKLAEYKMPTEPPKIVSENSCSVSNMADLLATPMKDSLIGGAMLPPTPGMLFTMPSITDTPQFRCPELTSMYLFGSATKSELNSPMMSAITPGFHIKSQETTPETGPASVEYSSGASYYKPDESDNLDRKLDQILRDSAKKRMEEKLQQSPVVQERIDMTCVEIPAEKLKVESVVLKRVKSTNELITAEEPHYTLASGIPDCVQDDSSCSSSTSSSSSSSSSSNSSSSSSSSSSSNDENDNDGTESSKKVSPPTSPNSLNQSGNALLGKAIVDKLSEIDSDEDTEWEKMEGDEALEEGELDEDSQLVSNDGEVRYPVRTWLTPCKEPPTKVTVTLPVKTPVKTPEKRAIREVDTEALKSKLERMRDKCKLDEALNAKKKFGVAMPVPAARRRGRPPKISPPQKKMAPIISPPPAESSPTQAEGSPQIVFCSALQLTLAANTQPIKPIDKNAKEPSPPPSPPPLTFADIDENAVSIDINKEVALRELKSSSKMTLKNLVAAKLVSVKSNMSNTGNTPRRCQPIAPQAAPTRGRPKKKIINPVLMSSAKEKKEALVAAAIVSPSPPTADKRDLGKKDADKVSPAVARNKKADDDVKKATPPSATSAGNTKSPKAKIRIYPVTGHVGKSNPRTSSRVLKAKSVLLAHDRELEQVIISKQAAASAIVTKTETKITKKVEPKQKIISEKPKGAAKRQEKEKPVLEINKNEKKQEKQNLRETRSESKEKPPTLNLSASSVEEECKPAVFENSKDGKEIKETKTLAPLPPAPSLTPAYTKTLPIEIKSPSPPPQEHSSSLSPTPASKIENEELNDDEEEEYDFVTIAEDDKEHFVELTYEGPEEDAPPKTQKPRDLNGFQLTVALSEQEKYTWSISEEFCFFENKPSTTGNAVVTSARRGSKKRNVRVSAVVAAPQVQVSTVVQPAPVALENQDMSKKSFTSTEPTATSTPTSVKPPSPVVEKNIEVLTELKRKSKNILDKEQKKNKPAAEAKAPTSKIMEMEDIESILSHLHGESQD